MLRLDCPGPGCPASSDDSWTFAAGELEVMVEVILRRALADPDVVTVLRPQPTAYEELGGDVRLNLRMSGLGPAACLVLDGALNETAIAASEELTSRGGCVLGVLSGGKQLIDENGRVIDILETEVLPDGRIVHTVNRLPLPLYGVMG